MSTRSPAQVAVSSTASTPLQVGRLQRSQVYQVQAKQDQESQSEQAEVAETADRPSSTFQHNFSQVPVRSAGFPIVQPKLVIGQPHDRYEQEADRVADQVMQMSDVGMMRSIQPLALTPHHSLQRQTESLQDEDEDEVVQAKALPDLPIQALDLPPENTLQRQMEEESDEEEAIQTKPAPGRASNVTPGFQTQLRTSQPAGHPLHPPTRQFMESRFNHDFSGVRVHSDRPAAHLNQQVGAQAFTHGQHIYFGQGRYQPTTPTGQRLLAHELTHVVQQTGGQTEAQIVQMRSTQPMLQARIAPAEPASPSRPVPGSRSPDLPAEPSPPEAPAPQSPGTTLPEVDRPSPSSEASQPLVVAEDAPIVDAPEVSPAAAEAAPTVELLMPEPPTELSEAAQSRLEQSQNRAAVSAAVESDLPSADANVADARAAVEEPEAETSARAEGELVAALGERPQPSPEIEQLCETIRREIREQRPSSESELANANPQRSAEAAGNQLERSVAGDVNRVQGGYDQLNQPPEGTPEQLPQEIDSPPQTVETPEIGAANAIPDPIPAKNVLLETDVTASQARLDQAGMNSPVAEMAAQGDPAGPIAAAQTAQTELQETAQRDPAEVMAEQQAALTNASADMGALQQVALEALSNSRAATVTGVQNQQGAMVVSEEQQRAQIGQQAQTIFDQAQQQVNTLLTPLPQTAMSRWDTGVAVLSQQFEQDLARVKRWLDERYSGTGGAITELWDDLTGMPDWVTDAYNRAEQSFGDGVCNLLREISVEINSVIATCEQIIDRARQDIAALFSNLPAELQEWARTEQSRFDEQLNGLQNRVTQVRDDLNRDMAGRAAQAVHEVRQRVETLREEAGGLLGRIANAVNQFLEDPARFIINGLLNLVGIAATAFWAVVDRVGQAIDSIAEDPIGFAQNLLQAVGQGFQRFFDNVGDHLLGGLLDWLFSGLGAVGLQIPRDLSLPSIIAFFLELMGFTWQRVRQLIARFIGEENVALIEKAFELVSTLIEKGIEGIVEMIQPFLSLQSILDQVIQSAVDYVKGVIATQVAVRILALFNPVGAIVQAVEAIYKVLKWIFENAARIFSLVETVVGGITQIITGNVGGMAQAIETALVRLLVPVIDFIAGFAGLGDLPNKVADTIKGFQEWVESILERVIRWLAERAKSLLRSLGLGGEAATEEGETGVRDWSEPFTNTLGERHRLRAITQGNRYSLIINPDPIDVLIFLQSGAIDQNAPNVSSATSLAHEVLEQLEELDSLEVGTSNYQFLQRDISENIDRLAHLLSEIRLSSGNIPTGSTENDPIPMIWYKPIGLYRSIVLPQMPESENPFFVDDPSVVRVPNRAGLADVRRSAGASTDDFTIGVDPSGPFYPRIGKVYPRVRAGVLRTGRKQQEFRTLLRALGFNWGSFEADHVRDLQWGGQDDYHNLWSLERSYNQAANQVLDQPVDYESSSGTVIQGQPIKDTPLNLYFIIREMRG
ncbi:MAG: DNA/RNA non-specific endonuclease [Elainellaceae cyanobacterium]